MKTYSPLIEEKIRMFSELKLLVQAVLDAHQDQPLSAAEVHVATEKLAGRKIQEVSVRKALGLFEDAGLVASRVETDKERQLRFNGVRNTSVNARLFARGTLVPKRTKAVVIEGAQPKSGGRRPGSKNKPKTVKKTQPQELTAYDIVQFMIDSRVKELQARVTELEDRLAKIKRLV